MANGSEFLSDFTRSSYFQNTGLICELWAKFINAEQKKEFDKIVTVRNRNSGNLDY